MKYTGIVVTETTVEVDNDNENEARLAMLDIADEYNPWADTTYVKGITPLE